MGVALNKLGTSTWCLVPDDSEYIATSKMSVPVEQPIKSDRSFSNILTTVLALNFAGTVLALLFEAIFNSDVPPSPITRYFVDSFVYANCIGTLWGVAVFHYTPRLMFMRPPLNWILLIIMILSLTFIGSLMAGFTLMGIGAFPPGDYSWIALHRMGLGFLISVVFGISTYFYESVRLSLMTTTQQLHAKKLEGERAHKLAVEASLSSLESRLHPHFLFNTLNSISSLIQEDPQLAERMVERLAALLRFSLDSSHRSTILLEQELKIAIDYLEIEKARFGERLHYLIEVPSELNAVRVPPFIIQTLVENSVKHAVSLKRRGGEIQLKVSAVDDRVTIEVTDDGAGFTADAITVGHGLDNLRARLAALFGQEAKLDVLRKDGLMVVSASFPHHQPAKVDTV
jgi:two-component system sensor histidine kinase AlgZ